MDDIRLIWHAAGIHTQCAPVKSGATWRTVGDGTHKSCPRAGTIDRIHDHDFPGLLPCGCDEFGDDY